jgi:hypothetical protein
VPYDDQPEPSAAVPPQRTGRPAPAVVPRAQPAPPPADASFGLYGQAEPSSSITARLSELEARLAEAPPARPAPVKKAAAKKAPSKRVPRTVAEPELLPEVVPEPEPEPVVVAAPRATLGRGLRAALLLALLLLSLAAGLAAAAVVEARPATWQASTLVTLTPGAAVSDAAGQVSAAQPRYADRVNAPAFTTLTAFQAGLQAGQVRRPVFAEAVGADQLRLVVRGSSRAATQRLVTAAGGSLVDAVRADQLLENPTAGAALTAEVQGTPASPVRLLPHDRDAQVAGLLSGGAVLLLGGVAFLLRRTSRANEREVARPRPLNGVKRG